MVNLINLYYHHKGRFERNADGVVEYLGDDLGRGLKLIRFDSELVRMLDHAKRNGGSVHVFWEHVVDAPIEVDVVNVEDDDFSQQPATEPQ
ncbi:hypothetical protein PIB30_071170 [Stylosanthes scabra]|uniref:Uncharacterized protein n=1 Tax=Stylosanthes scabra TaxID=79078 RepID=A0ABU6QPA8_9FABA|nr:hypothetical protein [Stylosanthes scabra]